MGLQSVAKDVGFDWSIELRADASAAIGICRRRGLGKVRHLHTADLWVQDRLKAGDLPLRKTPGGDNIADMMTKYLPRADLEKHVSALGLYPEEGRALSAPKIAEDQQPTPEPKPTSQTSRRPREKEELPQEETEPTKDRRKPRRQRERKSAHAKRTKPPPEEAEEQEGQNEKRKRTRGGGDSLAAARCLEEALAQEMHETCVGKGVGVQEEQTGQVDQVKPGKRSRHAPESKSKQKA